MFPDTYRVVLLGGAPRSGKSTVAGEVARRLGWDIVGSDDLGLVARAVTSRSSHPELHYQDDDYRDYYVRKTVGQMWEDALAAHLALWPAIASVVRARASWGRPAVVEGWALLPRQAAELNLSEVAALWLTVDDHILESRVRADTDFYQGAADPELMIRNFVERSIRYQRFVAREAVDVGARVLPVIDDAEQVSDLATRVMASISGG